MPVGTCDPASRGDTVNENTVRIPHPAGGYVQLTVRFKWDGVSVKPNCQGQVTLVQVSNSSTQPAWVLLPAKKQPPLWLELPAGSNVSMTSPGQLNTAGVRNALDTVMDRFVFTQPA